MFTIDERVRGLPASREQVVALYQSLNTPHLAIPGKRAGPAQAFVVGLRSGAGVGALVYLFLAESEDCAVYADEPRYVRPDAYASQEADALAFLESMGFMMDDVNWRAQPPAQQDELLRTLPPFFRDPRQAPIPPGVQARAEDKRATASALGRLLASF